MTVLQRCQDKNLALNWEKCHFMVTEGIVLGYMIFAAGLEVDQAKVSIIRNLIPPTTVNGIRSFLGHAGFYRRFIRDFSKIARPLCRLLEKDTKFNFDESFMSAKLIYVLSSFHMLFCAFYVYIHLKLIKFPVNLVL